jgi:MFS family permease
MLTEDSLASPRGLALPVGLLVAVAVMADFAVGARVLAAAYRAIEWGASPLWLGLVAAASGGAYAINLLLIGRFIDRVGRRLTVTAGCLLYAAMLLGHYYSTQVWHLALFSFLFGISGAFLWPPLSAWFCDLAAGDPRRLSRMLGNYNLSWSGGLTVGILLSGVLWQALGPRVFVVLAAGLVAAAIALAFVPEVSRAAAVSCAPEEPPEQADRVWRLLLSSRLANFLCWFGAGAMLALLPKLTRLLGLSESRTGMAIAGYYGAILMFNWLSRTSRRWHFRRWPLALPVALILLPLGLLLVARTAPLFAVACYVMGVCAAFSGVTSLYYSVSAQPERRAAGTSMSETVAALGGLAGSLLAGFMAQRLLPYVAPEIALRGPFALVAALAVLTAAAQWVVWRWGRTAVTSHGS